MRSILTAAFLSFIIFNQCYATDDKDDFIKRTRPLTINEIDENLRVDDNFQLYFNGNKVITENRITFDWWVNWAVILGGIGAFIAGIITLVEFLIKRIGNN